MGRTLEPRYLASLELSHTSDAELNLIAGDVGTAAKTSALVAASTAMQASVASIATKAASLAANNKLVADDHVKLRVDLASEATSRTDLVGELRTYGTLVGAGAKSPGDVHAAGLPPRPPRPARGILPTVPIIINNKVPKKGHGKTTLSVGDLDADKRQFVAQESLDGGQTWSQLGLGHGRTRVVSGPSGTKVMVQFAMIRSGAISAWSAPITVVIP